MDFKIIWNPLKEKISGSDLFPRVCNLAANKGYSIFLLGAAEGVAVKAAENLQRNIHILLYQEHIHHH
jgi:UDP-N-acetyl-D-mannosaminuronic acid transferase (WecB/TagA/CpsF family)